MIPWRTKLSREEVAAHAAAHPIKQWVSAAPHAYWLKWSPSEHISPFLVFLGIVDGDRLLAARLIERVGTPVEWGRKRPSRVLRLTPRGEAEVAKLPKPHSLMLMGHGDRFDCAYAAACIGVFADEYPTATEAHCPPTCAHRKDVRREAAGGSSPLAEMQRYAPGEI